MPATVKVRGDALIRPEPSEVLLWVTLTALAELAARIDGPRWQIAPSNPDRREAAKDA